MTQIERLQADLDEYLQAMCATASVKIQAKYVARNGQNHYRVGGGSWFTTLEGAMENHLVGRGK